MQQIMKKDCFPFLEREEYLDLVIDCLEHLNPDIVIHRVTERRSERASPCPVMGIKKAGSFKSSSSSNEGARQFSGKGIFLRRI